MKTPTVLAYGMGVNSAAAGIECYRRGVEIDLVIAADTSGERPETYAACKIFSEWLVAHGMPPVTIVKNPGPSIEEDCARRNALPSIAYGWKSCSDRWKARPQKVFIKELYGPKQPYIQIIGYDAGEERRVRKSQNPLCENRFPLIEWGLYREDCIAICESEGIPIGKSACFFCPSMKKHEIFQLAKEHPDLMERALRMEANADLTSVKGLGRSYAWKDLLKNEAEQAKLFKDDQPEIPCGCYDGDSE